jgi:hypothetical protein
MEVQRKLMVHRNALLLLMVAFLLQLISCKDSKTNKDVSYGKVYFYQNCSVCHERVVGYENAPSLLVLYNYDSLTLLKKLVQIKKDSIHGNYCVDYSDKEINSLHTFIKKYFERRY